MIRSAIVLAGLVVAVTSSSLFAQGGTRAVAKGVRSRAHPGPRLGGVQRPADPGCRRLLLLAIQPRVSLAADRVGRAGPLSRRRSSATRSSSSRRAGASCAGVAGTLGPGHHEEYAAAPAGVDERHPVASYFKPTNGQTRLRFFTHPPNAGTVQEVAYLLPNELVLGDLLFESPTRLWDEGTYALVVRYDGAEAVLPIELR